MKAAHLKALRDRLDPFALAEVIDQKLTCLYALACPRRMPEPKPAPPALTAAERQTIQALSESFGIPVSVGTERNLSKRRVTSQMARRSPRK